ncbi:hypothetical protein [Sulfitobacter sp. JB4-11]|uniref:hypothetical protein n=1 Tax=Sulfitobacter rhodophyticola TaxID=3238304 RepID=UPI003514E870
MSGFSNKMGSKRKALLGLAFLVLALANASFGNAFVGVAFGVLAGWAFREGYLIFKDRGVRVTAISRGNT